MSAYSFYDQYIERLIQIRPRPSSCAGGNAVSLAVCGTDHPGTIMGWCGLDGTRNHAEPEIFIRLDEEYRNRGYGTKCVRELLRIAAEDYALSGVHGGCARENVASARAMEKGGMVQYGTEENGDPLFRFCAKR